MTPPDLFVNLLGCLYGLLLVSATFLRTRVTEALRVDALFLPGHSEQTRPLNLPAGLLVAGYALHSLLTHPL